MDFGMLYELQMPKPWTAQSETDTFFNAIHQVIHAESLGFSHCWCLDHRMLPE